MTTHLDRQAVLDEAREIHARMTNLVARLEQVTDQLNEQAARAERDRQESEGPDAD